MVCRAWQAFYVKEKKCSYCTYPVIEGRKIRYRSPEKVVDEIEHLKEQGIDYLHFTDSALNIPEHHALAILNELVKEMLLSTIRHTSTQVLPHQKS